MDAADADAKRGGTAIAEAEMVRPIEVRVQVSVRYTSEMDNAYRRRDQRRQDLS